MLSTNSYTAAKKQLHRKYLSEIEKQNQAALTKHAMDPFGDRVSLMEKEVIRCTHRKVLVLPSSAIQKHPLENQN